MNELVSAESELNAALERIKVLEEAQDVALDRAFINGAEMGFKFGYENNQKGLTAALENRRKEILAALLTQEPKP